MTKKGNSWNTVPKNKRRGGSTTKEVTREQLARAIQNFEKKGGLIQRLPPQAELRRKAVGGHLDTGYETVFDS